MTAVYFRPIYVPLKWDYLWSFCLLTSTVDQPKPLRWAKPTGLRQMRKTSSCRIRYAVCLLH